MVVFDSSRGLIPWKLFLSTNVIFAKSGMIGRLAS